MRRTIDHRRAFTLLELIVVFTVVCILFALMIPATIRMQAQRKRMVCVNHLKNVGLTFLVFASENRDYYPWQTATNGSAFKSFDELLPTIRAFSNQLSTPIILNCPADSRKPAAGWGQLSRTNVSYFTGLDAMIRSPSSIVAGDRNFTTNGVSFAPGLVNVESNVIAGWDGRMHRFQGTVTVGDGSVQQTSSKYFDQMIHKNATNRFVVP